MRKTGFSLSEVLIALGLIGVVAAMSVPKLISSSGAVQRISALKETVSVLSQIVEKGAMTGELNDNFDTYMLDNIKAVRKCRTNSTTEGCWDDTTQGTMSNVPDRAQPGVVLATGAVIAGFDDCCYLANNVRWNSVVIDANGRQPPNTPGADQIRVTISFGDNSLVSWGATHEPQTIMPHYDPGDPLIPGAPANMGPTNPYESLWREMFNMN